MSFLSRRADARAFGGFVSALKGFERKFRHRRFLKGDTEIAEGYKAVLDLISVGLDCYVYNSPYEPRFISLVSPERKIGGDNADALYFFAPISPDRTYTIRGTVGRTAYIGFTVYGGKTPKKFHIVGNFSTPDVVIEKDGSFTLILGPGAEGPNAVPTDNTANCVIIRRYFTDKQEMTEEPGIQDISTDAPIPEKPLLHTSESVGTTMRNFEQFLRGWFRILPMIMPPIPKVFNKMTPPRPASTDTGHWSTPDNIHSMGFYRLRDNEALIIKGRSPKCTYWSVHLWNPYLQTYDYQRCSCALSGADVRLEDDGSWELVAAKKNPGRPNWIDTAGHNRGMVYFRWLQAEETPEKPECRIVDI